MEALYDHLFAIFPLENHAYSTGRTNKVKKVVVTKPPTITVANGR